MKKIVRLTESELKKIVENSAIRLVENKLGRKLNEDILGDNWHENDEVMNNYEPFETQMDDEDHDFSGQGEENIDPTLYDDLDWYRDDVGGFNDSPSDGDLYASRW
jgi:hypothetical protein